MYGDIFATRNMFLVVLSMMNGFCRRIQMENSSNKWILVGMYMVMYLVYIVKIMNQNTVFIIKGFSLYESK
ncbi:hypothetical protein BTW32_09720 [Bacillus thuringiensis]|nr:hypothetical protein BTW32_09720 [Bacillus thuringiensis]